MVKTLEHEWELELPASSAEELLAALATRDRLFGQEISLEPEEDPAKAVDVWIGTSDALAEGVYHLAVYAELKGAKEFLEAAVNALQEVFEEQVKEGAADAAAARLLDRKATKEIEFRAVPEDDELPGLIVPEWLAPEGAELPWGFRPVASDGQPWPTRALLEEHSRVAVVPFEEEFLAYALPEIEEGDEDDEEE